MASSLDKTTVLKRLTELDRHDPQRRLFGAAVHEFRLQPYSSVASRCGQMLDPLHFVGLQSEIEDIEIRSHVIGVGGSGQRQDSDIESESKNNLADGSTVAFGDSDQFGMSHHVVVGGQ